ncbi:MAG: acyl-CoA dehydratase activase [Peptococcaceae bacterium]|nr:acyl-CoA dehydratase activase [Peptococcaceae bacterium]
MYYCGIDIGSITAKCVILRDEEMAASVVALRGYNSAEAATAVLNEALGLAGIEKDSLVSIVSTGYGRAAVREAHRQFTEISCHALGASCLVPGAATVIDVGGQDSKAISVDPAGKVLNFVMNDKCAAGTGRFLEVMAHALEVDLDDFGAMSLKAAGRAEISNMCTVFAESEVISRIASGAAREEIIAGIHDAMASRIASMAARVEIRPKVVLTGGVSKNIGLVRALEERLGQRLEVPEKAQIAGALGAALMAKRTSDVSCQTSEKAARN